MYSMTLCLGRMITMQKELLNANKSVLLLFVWFDVISDVILNLVDNIQKFPSRFWLCLQSQISLGHSNDCEETMNQYSESSNRNGYLAKEKDNGNFSREDLEMVIKKLGLFSSMESEELEESMSSDELSQLFDEKEPSLEEVKEAFNVFDQNKDGFIDAKELQRVLCILGLEEGFELENCRKMIRISDENGDGRIDFNEFVKFMENSFC